MRISDWSSDVCSSDLLRPHGHSRRVCACIAQAAADRKDRRCAPVVLRRLACPADLAVADAFPPRRNCAGLGTWPARLWRFSLRRAEAYRGTAGCGQLCGVDGVLTISENGGGSGRERVDKIV